MSRAIKWTPRAEHDLARLDRRTRERIRQAVYRLAGEGRGDVRPVEGAGREWRLRVGRWRVRFTLQDDALVILRVLPRGGAYKK